MHRSLHDVTLNIPTISNIVSILRAPLPLTNYHRPCISTHAPDLYSSLITQCTVTKSLTDTQKIHAHLVKSGHFSVYLGDKMVDGYLKCGSILYARKLFDEMPQRHIVTWNSLIASYISNERSGEAVKLYSRMVGQEGVSPDEYTLSSIFKAFAGLGLVLEGKCVHCQAIVWGLEISNMFVGSALVDMYAKFGNMRDAELVCCRVKDQDVVLLTALIVGYTQHGNDVGALEVFLDMTRKGIEVNEFTFASILISSGNLGDVTIGRMIHGLMVKSGFVSVIASHTSLLTMYSKCGMVDDSFTVFRELGNPNQVTWTSLITGLVQNDREEIAMLQFRKMLRNSTTPNSFTLSSVLRGCASLAMLETGRQIHAIITKQGLDKNRFVGAGLIDFYGKCGTVEQARSVFDMLTEIDTVCMNSMIYSYALNGSGHEALGLYEKMKDLDLEQNDVTFLSILLACNNAGMVEKGHRIFSYLKHNSNVQLSGDHYACMVDLLGKSGRLEEAETLVNEAKNTDVVLWRTLLSACRTHGEVKMAERMMDKVLELAPGDEGTHVLLSNLYASTCNWSQVIEMKSTMRGMRLKKQPAMSWVEIDREIHTFMAGDLSHPESGEIIQMLGKLIERVKVLGYVPDTKYVLQDIEEEKKERSLYYHSEKLAIAFTLCRARDKTTNIRILKNLRVCGDCHNWIKFVSIAVGREIIARDSKRFHHFKDGLCTCGDYW